WYLFDVNPSTPPAFEVASGEAFTLEVRGAFSDIADISTVPTPFTPACDGHPLAPIAGPVRIRGARPGDAVVVDLLEITPHGDGSITGTGVECDATVRARVELEKGRKLDRPILEVDDTVQVLGFGPTVELATEDAARGAVEWFVGRTGMDRREAYMLLSIVGE